MLAPSRHPAPRLSTDVEVDLPVDRSAPRSEQFPSLNQSCRSCASRSAQTCGSHLDVAMLRWETQADSLGRSKAERAFLKKRIDGLTTSGESSAGNFPCCCASSFDQNGNRMGDES